MLAQIGIRFLNIGGTSAGAINAILLAAIDKPEKEKSTRILELLANKNLEDFVDGDDDAQDFIDSLMAPKIKIASVIWNGVQILDNLKEDMGIKATVISSTQEAKSLLIEGHEFDYVISDIIRSQNTKAGVEFIEWLANTQPHFKRKIIYYIHELDLSRGVPPYAFGITDSPVELLHLIFDLSFRRKV